MKQDHINEIKAVIIFAIATIILASLISFVPEDLPWYTSDPNVPTQNLIKITGAYTAGSLLFVFGYSSYAVVIFLLFLSWNKFTSKEVKFTVYKFISMIVLFCVISSLFNLIGRQDSVSRFQRSGMVGMMFADFLVKYIGKTGAYIILCSLGTLALILSGEFLIVPFVISALEKSQSFFSKFNERIDSIKSVLNPVKSKFNIKKAFEEEKLKKILQPKFNKPDKTDEVIKPIETMIKKDKIEPKIKIAPDKIEEGESFKEDKIEIVGEYHLPPIDLLENPPKISSDKIQNDLVSGAKLLEETLAQFGVIANVADIERGPAITRYELEPAPGVKVQKFTTLSDDIALAMRATAVRIVAPIPGKNRVGIEVPNDSSATVYLKDVLSTNKFRSSKSKLTLSLGKDIAGKPIIADLAEMPHLLIAGTTGSGKTVCVNGIIMSMLLNASPEDIKFLIIDPKMVELAQYNDIPHLLCPTITESQKASAGLNWVVSEMESRYRKLSKGGVRSIKEFNKTEDEKMHYIVVIIDELADLMQVSAKAVESAITRIAQLSRAVGIHLILATQRPSVDVITGVIKANFPARISFKVASKIDSRTVLDMNGAETLLGKGDMLFIQPGEAKPIRGQCSFVKDDEIKRVIRFIKDQQAPSYDDSIIKHQRTGQVGGSDQYDECFDEAVRLVIETNQASVSILQRRMRLGYTRAARLIDMMEQHGIVGPYCGSKPREILVDREQWLLDHLEKDNENG